METTRISRTLMKRLPVYLDHLKNLPEEESYISATAIAQALGMGDVQVRKDLAKVSTGGRRRTGRSREQLIRDIETCLDCTCATTSIVVGTGSLGQALMDYSGFDNSGLNVLAGFDTEPQIKKSLTGKPVYPLTRLESFCKCYDVRIGIIAVAPEQAQAVCDELMACGISAFWNFSPVHLKVPDHVVVQSENLAISLTALRLQLKEREEKSK